MAEQTRSRWPRARVHLIPLALLLAIGLARLTTGGYKVDSALYLGVAADMVDTGRWWTPHAGSVPYFNKPPLVLWLHAVVISVFGPALIAARALQIALAAAAVLATTHTARLLAGPTVAMLTGSILALSFPFAVHLNRILLDYAIVALIMLAVLCVVRMWKRDARGGAAAAHAVAAGVAIGLAMLCKPFFALLALPVLAVWLAAVGRARLALWLPLSALVACALAAPWHLSMIQIHGDLFTSQYFGREIASRTSNREGFGNRPWWQYLWFIAREWHPWQLMLYAMLATLAAAALSSTARTQLARHAPAIALALIWTGLWLGMLSLFGDKRIRYMMHVWPMMSLLAALWLCRLSPPALRRTGTRFWGRLAAVLLLAGAGGAIVGLAVGEDGPREGWLPVHVAIREIDADTPLWEFIGHPPAAGAIYLKTGRWPEPLIYGSPAAFRTPPPQSLLVLSRDIYDTLAAHRTAAGTSIPAPTVLTDRGAIIVWSPDLADDLQRIAGTGE